jgi:hypothetical protein
MSQLNCCKQEMRSLLRSPGYLCQIAEAGKTKNQRATIRIT